ncbi:hypothetical protein CAPTEDRAFT_222835 [Capitella teleta]|uniref:Uncharacterized protein n=1 Tax=Capitella teleta TaxID=283909 RepID=R7T395_CAPTE|nr:hypothetical protein CAPTEDRAFT_222835 [Capitella teleta]|eukprot:ELT87056.1 hypothetical protein CAPTEDRAFT_222835 [Capitella teleta]
MPMQTARRRMSIDMRSTSESAGSIRRQTRPRSRRNGMGNILTGLSPSDVSSLQSNCTSRHSSQPSAPLGTNQDADTNSSSVSLASEVSSTMNSVSSLSSASSEVNRVSVSPLRGAIGEALRADTDSDLGSCSMTPPSPTYFKKRRNAVSNINIICNIRTASTSVSNDMHVQHYMGVIVRLL